MAEDIIKKRLIWVRHTWRSLLKMVLENVPPQGKRPRRCLQLRYDNKEKEDMGKVKQERIKYYWVNIYAGW